MYNQMHIPSEITSFFEVEEGQTLLVKGLPGTGKTTLAFEIMNSVCKRGNGMYISTRVNPQRIYAMFPWICDIIPTKNVINATQNLLLNSLKSIDLEGPNYGVVLDFFKTFFDEAEEMEDPMIVIDSWDAVVNYTSHILKDSQHSLEQNICEFARDMGIHLIFVSESADLMPLDYIVDGVVTLEHFKMMGPPSSEGRSSEMMTRYTREILLNKLRGVEICQNQYTCTLHEGRFLYFEPCIEHIDSQIILRDIERIPDPNDDYISTGISDFDEICGGLKYGSCNVIEVDHGVGKRYYELLTTLASNSLKNGRAVHVVPSIGYQLSPMDTFVPSNVKVLEPGGGDHDDWYETLFEQWDTLRTKTKRPILNVMGLDTMEFAFGFENVLSSSTRLFQKWKETNDINVLVVKTGQQIIRMTTHVADTYFMIKELNGGLCLYGLIPRTVPYYITQDVNKNIILVPIV